MIQRLETVVDLRSDKQASFPKTVALNCWTTIGGSEIAGKLLLPQITECVHTLSNFPPCAIMSTLKTVLKKTWQVIGRTIRLSLTITATNQINGVTWWENTAVKSNFYQSQRREE